MAPPLHRASRPVKGNIHSLRKTMSTHTTFAEMDERVRAFQILDDVDKLTREADKRNETIPQTRRALENILCPISHLPRLPLPPHWGGRGGSTASQAYRPPPPLPPPPKYIARGGSIAITVTRSRYPIKTAAFGDELPPKEKLKASYDKGQTRFIKRAQRSRDEETAVKREEEDEMSSEADETQMQSEEMEITSCHAESSMAASRDNGQCTVDPRRLALNEVGEGEQRGGDAAVKMDIDDEELYYNPQPANRSSAGPIASSSSQRHGVKKGEALRTGQSSFKASETCEQRRRATISEWVSAVKGEDETEEVTGMKRESEDEEIDKKIKGKKPRLNLDELSKALLDKEEVEGFERGSDSERLEEVKDIKLEPEDMEFEQDEIEQGIGGMEEWDIFRFEGLESGNEQLQGDGRGAEWGSD